MVIHDNVLLVQESVRDLNRHRQGNNVALKLDMAKAYDQMSWYFIIKMLRYFGFLDWWVSSIFGPWFSVLVPVFRCWLLGSATGFFSV